MKLLRLFPNTGHQFFTLDLEELLAERRNAKAQPPTSPPLEELMRFVTLQQPGNLPPDKRDKESGWLPWEGLSWVLYNYSIVYDPVRNESRPALNLAIESNLGDHSRGTILQLERGNGGKCAAPQPSLAGREATLAPAEMDVLPYVSRDINDLQHEYPEGAMWLEDPFGGGRVRLPSRMGPRYSRDFNYDLPPEKVKILWIPSGGDQPVDVDLIVDLGNSRTAALLIEDHGAFVEAGDFGRRTYPVRFLPPGQSFASLAACENVEECSVIDSWALVHRSSFANIEPPTSIGKLRDFVASFGDDEVRARLLDQRFVSLSPALVGGGQAAAGAAKTLARAVLAAHHQTPQFYFSSPKRYAWDDMPIGLVAKSWDQIPNEFDADAGQFKPLAGPICMVMHPEHEDFDLPLATLQGSDLQLYDNAPVSATYSRRDTVCWFALAILESAYRQINSVDFLEGRVRPKVMRRLRNVRVTYPAGWPGEERERYLGQWRRALRLFAQAHLENPLPRSEGGEGPMLVAQHLDEVVSSQLPILLSGLRNQGHNPKTWFDLHGAAGDVTVMNIDFGGGTTDIAVVRYTISNEAMTGAYGNQRVVLRPSLLYRAANSIAGDLIVKRMIEEIVLPAWLSAKGGVPFVCNTEARDLIVSLLRNPRQSPVNTILPDATARLGWVVRLAFVPLAYEILRRLSAAERDGSTAIAPISVSEIADGTAIRELNRLALQLIVQKAEHWGKQKTADLRRLGNPELFRQWFESITGQGSPSAELPFRPDAEIDATVNDLNGIVTSVLGGTVASLAEVAAKHKCNFVIVAGKPSELPEVRRMVVRELPVPPNHILQAKDFPAGKWYPAEFLEKGRIRDSKTLAVVGAAIYQNLLNGDLEGFQLAGVLERPSGASFYWGILGVSCNPREFAAAVLFDAGTPAGKRWRGELPLQSWIGRSLRLSDSLRPEPIYQINLTPEATRPGLLPVDFNTADARVSLTLELAIEKEVGERLRPVPGTMELWCHGLRVEIDAERFVQLRLRTLMEDAFWLDSPSFDVDPTRLFARA